MQGTKFYLSDNESAGASQTVDLSHVLLGENGDAACVTFVGKPENLLLRCESAAKAEEWFELTWAALECAERVKPRDCGLPASDPRNGLPFVDVPPLHRTKFQNLDRAVLYWFSPIKKFGVASKFTGKYAEESRMAFISTQAFYVTKPDSELTRCMKLQTIERLYIGNSIDPKLSGEPWCLIKMALPEYDFLLSCANVDKMVHCLCALYKQIKKVDLQVVTVPAVADPHCGLQLVRPSGFEMSMVVPSSREKLKKALDDFAEKHGIQFTTTGTAVAAGSGAAVRQTDTLLLGRNS